MMRSFACLAALVATQVASHPLCFIDDKPTDYDQVLTFCDNSIASSGACCTDDEEAQVVVDFNAATPVGEELTGDCPDLYKQVVCARCHSYSAHLYEYLGAELGMLDGLTMTSDFCTELVTACDGQINFPTYDGGSVDYCTKHTGGGSDFFWSYPYEEPEVFEPGLNEVFPDLPDDQQPGDTVSMRQTPDGSQWWLLGISGQIYAVDSDSMGESELVIDVSGPVPSGGNFYDDFEEGLLDVAFGPMFGDNSYPQYFYVSYTVLLDDGEMQRNRLARFTYVPGDAVATRATEEVLLTTVPKFNSIHSAGWLGFKPSDYGSPGYSDLYWTTGDGGPQTDPFNHSQDETTMLGAMMRISVPADGTGYTIPSGNYPGAKAEVCAIGLRNPWRCGFDRLNDDLYCGDVGHTLVEEINFIECGNNYGWSRFEGSRCQEAVQDNEFNPPCDGISRSGFTYPLFEYCHPDYDSTDADEQEFTGGADTCGDRFVVGNCVIGGYVYRGNFFSDLLDGAYIFGDSTMKNIYFLREEEDGWAVGTIISDASVQIVSFAEDVNGEIMLLDYQHNMYHMPCGDLCATTCLDQAEDQPTYESLGCYADVVNDRALPIEGPNCGEGETAMSPAICASYCETLGSTLFGVQYSFQCFCGPSTADYDKHGSLSSDNCEYLCDANPDFFCGGFSTIEVFTIGDPTPTEAPAPTPLVNPSTQAPGTQAPASTAGPVLVGPSTAPTTPAPVNAGAAGYLGCFGDSQTDRVFSVVVFSGSMTTAICADTCADYAYYGTQFGGECWCGNNTDYDVYGEATCDMGCTGDSSDICGGNNAMSFYSTGSVVETPSPVPDEVTPSPVPDEETPSPVPDEVTPSPVVPTASGYLGCFGDSQADRVFSVVTGSGSMTTAICASTCADYAYYGTQFGGECWCGNNADYDVYGEATCDMGCTGDSSDICGGFNAMSFYSTGSVVETPSPVPDEETPSPVPDEVTPSPVPDEETPSPVPDEETPSPVVPTEPGYLGCFGDSQADRVFSVVTGSGSMTTAICASTCADYAYYGTQYGRECWCGNNADYDVYGEATCDMGCTGDSSETCGGNNAMSFYSTGLVVETPSPVPDEETPSPIPDEVTPSPTEPTESGYLGCFGDSQAGRVFSVVTGSGSMTTAICASTCADYAYYGTQYGRECWCGNNAAYDVYGEATCDMGCTGDSSEKCGGFNAMSVYGTA